MNHYFLHYLLFYGIPLFSLLLGIYTIHKAQKGLVGIGIILLNLITQPLVFLLCVLLYDPPVSHWQLYAIAITSLVFCVIFWNLNRKLIFIYLIPFFISVGFIIPSFINVNNVSCEEIQNTNKERVWFDHSFAAPSDIVEAQTLNCHGPYYGGGFEGSSAFNVKYLKVKIEAQNWPKWEEKLLALEKTIFSPKTYGDAKKIWYSKSNSLDHFSIKGSDESEISILTTSPDHQFIYYYQCIHNSYAPLACKKINE